jgi:hypothetical protein
MVIKLNKGFGIFFLLGVLDMSIWVEIPPGDLICGDGTSGFSGSTISSSCIVSKSLVSHFLVFVSSTWMFQGIHLEERPPGAHKSITWAQHIFNFS